MKILHVAQDLEVARVPARAIHGLAQNVTLAWAGTPEGALDWLRRNTDTAAVIVEVEAQSCAPFVRQVRSSRLNTPVVVVAGSARLDVANAALHSGADGYLIAGRCLEQELPEIVAQAMDLASSRTRERTEMAAELAAQRRQLARERRLCAALQQQSLELEGALARSTAELAGAMSALECEREARTRDAEAATALAAALTDAESAHERARERAAGELADANERCEVLEGQRTQQTERCVHLEQTLAAFRNAHDDLERRCTDEIAEATARLAADRAAADAHVALAVAAREQSELRANRILAVALAREAELIEQFEIESAAKAVAESNVAAARMTSARRRNRSMRVVSGYRRHVRAEQLELETQLAHERRLTAETKRLQQSFDELQAAFQQLDDVAGDHAAARLRLEALVADRDWQLGEETLRHRAAEEDAQRSVAHLEERLRQASEERHAEAARLDALRREIEALRGLADRVPDLAAQLETSRHENRRQFERAPYGLCRSSADGTVLDANHSFVTLLGYRRAEELGNLSALTAAKERTGDLGWLLERARATRKNEAVETQWTTREGHRVIVRLQALVTPSGAIDIVAEDVTTVRALEGRLRQAQKMEAVGRLASEVAVTCEAVLGDVIPKIREWIVRPEPADLRRSGERMLEDVTQVMGFLRRLGSYGDEQKRALEPVSATRVLRDFAPVLKRLVGERIELVLPKSAGAFAVDVDAERLERVLTNVAGYARQRMPMGGQVKIDLASRAIGRRFASGHSNVRAGDHVLITVTELPSAGATPGDVPRQARPADTPGMELGVLAELISSCGGHLWLEGQPAGNMVVKIHLPKPAMHEERGGRLSRWRRAASAANIFA